MSSATGPAARIAATSAASTEMRRRLATVSPRSCVEAATITAPPAALPPNSASGATYTRTGSVPSIASR